MVNRGGQTTVSKEQMEQTAAQYLKQFRRLLQKSKGIQCSIGGKTWRGNKLALWNGSPGGEHYL